MVTTKGNRFELGFAGEEWHETLDALKVPIPGTRKAALVALRGGKYCIFARGFIPPNKAFLQCEDLIIAVAELYRVFERAQPNSSGNLTG